MNESLVEKKDEYVASCKKMERLVFLHSLGIEIAPMYKFAISKIFKYLKFSKKVEIADNVSREKLVCYFDSLNNLIFYTEDIMNNKIVNIRSKFMLVTNSIRDEFPDTVVVDLVVLIDIVLRRLGVEYFYYSSLDVLLSDEQNNEGESSKEDVFKRLKRSHFQMLKYSKD